MRSEKDPTGKIIQIDEGLLQSSQMVKKTVEGTLNAMLNAEADLLLQAEKYEPTDARKDTRAGHYTRKLDITAFKSRDRSRPVPTSASIRNSNY